MEQGKLGISSNRAEFFICCVADLRRSISKHSNARDKSNDASGDASLKSGMSGDTLTEFPKEMQDQKKAVAAEEIATSWQSTE